MSYIIDTHCDTLALLRKNNFLCGSSDMNLSLPRLIRGDVKLQCFAVCVHPDSNGKCFYDGMKLINEYDKLTSNTHMLMSIKNKGDIKELLASDKIGAMLTVEGGDMLEGNKDNFDILFEKGMRMFSPTWNNSNCLCGGIGENSDGLTDFGKEILLRCEEKGVIIDVSHISEKGFWDATELVSKPFIASHSNAKSVCSNKRNLDNEQLKAIKAHSGCVGVNFYPPFLNNSGKASTDDIIRHIEYIASCIGIEYVSIGSDFDGVENDLPKGMEHPGKLQNLCERLRKLNYSESDIDLVCHGNMLRIMNCVLK